MGRPMAITVTSRRRTSSIPLVLLGDALVIVSGSPWIKVVALIVVDGVVALLLHPYSRTHLIRDIFIVRMEVEAAWKNA